MALEHYLQLALTPGLGPILLSRLIAATGNAQTACRLSASQLQQVEGIGPAKASQIAQGLNAAAGEVPRQLQLAHEHQVKILCLEDPAYPTLLRDIPDPPPVLFIKGEFQDRDLNGFAIVGSRACSFYGREQAQRFGASLAGAGFTILSGGARGVDSSAHRGALSHPSGRTIAVLGCGVEQVYPPENASLFASIAERGAVISEYPLGTPPLAENFPRRNRLISGLARGVLVVEADERSGALITARCACEDHGRPVFALPGRIDNKLSTGPHRLIREGATLVTNLQEILEGLTPLPITAYEPSPSQTELFAPSEPALAENPVTQLPPPRPPPPPPPE